MAGHGVEALQKLGIDPADAAKPLPDLIVLDIMMPVMDGYQLNQRLQVEARTQGIPILVLTAKGQKMRDLFEMAPNVAAGGRQRCVPETATVRRGAFA